MDFTPEQITRLLEALGLGSDVTDAELVVVAVEELVTAPPVAAASAAAAGGVVLDPAAYDVLKADADRGRALAAASKVREAKDAVDSAIRAGKLPPARRQHWLDVIQADPAMAATLKQMPVVIPLEELGHCDPGANDPDGLTEPAGWFR
ncbi:hypothetical protein CH281_20335 [Rhodococcus sp. 06-221-2]|uniref:phage protease n=1 Tax=Rhodococcus sp. 06-221-2 TaxID=2022514 RepID=UPI000B9B773E|nr:phage protease [Rhodococcus sp. 06-221-2]OZC98916.1 hypothetical protein CH281_20335 [Rhodococcus sp. 06-221-2]